MSVYLIDGYNVLHEYLGHVEVTHLEDERNRLIDHIASYMGGSSDRAIVQVKALPWCRPTTSSRRPPFSPM